MGLVLLASPMLLWWWIHGDYERYVWIISGPQPYEQFGGGPFQLFMYTSLLLIGTLLTAVALLLKVALRRLG
jgi:hypothetical protein